MSVGRKQAVAGFASKTEAIQALHAEGKTPLMIAEIIGSTANSVVTRLRQLEKVASLPPAEKKRPGRKPKPAPIADDQQPDATPGIWTPEKLAKARRLFGLSMNIIAEALQVPPAELLAYGISGVIPPIGERQRVGELLQQMAEADHRHPAPTTIIALAAPAPEAVPPFIEGNVLQRRAGADVELQEQIELDRDDDEAELAALDKEENDDAEVEADEPETVEQAEHMAADGSVAASPDAGDAELEVTPPRLYRIPRPGGGYVHKSGEGTTRKLPEAWLGDARELEKLLKRYPELLDLDPEKVPG